MTPRARRLLLALPLLAAAGTSPLWAPRVLRRIDWFAADRVEVNGARLLAPHEVLAASGIRIGVNVWEDPAAWEAALRRHPVIAEARVTRELPSTLRIRIVEKMPAALVQAGTLRAATAEGDLLPVDPARAAVDLPVLPGPARADARGRVGDADVRAALAEVGRLTSLEPALMARVSEVRPAGRGQLRLVLGRPAMDVVLREGMDAPALLRLRAALDEVGRRAAADTTRRGRTQVDARFDDQVVVRTQS